MEISNGDPFQTQAQRENPSPNAHLSRTQITPKSHHGMNGARYAREARAKPDDGRYDNLVVLDADPRQRSDGF
jgi:hypothetical protein